MFKASKLWFDKFSKDVTQSRGGEVYFAHLMAPHSPYLLNSNCDTKLTPWISPYLLQESHNLKGPTLQSVRESYYKDYYEQVSCVYKKLTELMEKLENLDQFKNATIVINGDHGSRISSGQYFENLSERDFVDNYSTHFSIRSPHVEPGYDLRSVSVQRLFAEFIQGKGKTKPEKEKDKIVANSIDAGRVILVNMPDFGNPS